MLKFLFSRLASWSVLLSLPAAGPLFPAVVALLPAAGPLFPAVVALSPAVGPLFPAVVALSPAVGPLFYFLLIVYTVQCPSLFHRWFALRLFVSRHATLFVRALLLEPLIFDELFAHPRADQRVLLVVRWLRHQPSRAARGPLAASPAFTCCAWSAGCVASLHSLPQRALRVECCFLRRCGFVTWPLKLRAAVLMALFESPALALHGLSVQFCFVVVAFLVNAHGHVATPLWPALAEDLKVDAIVWPSQHLELFASSFLPSVSRAAVPPRFAVVTALAGIWWSVRHSRPSHAYTDRPVCVSGGAIFAPCCPAASTFGAMIVARESPSRSLPLLSLHRAFPAVHLPFSRLDTLSTRSTQAFSFWTLYARHGSVNLELLACDIRCC